MKQIDDLSTRIKEWVTRTFPLAQQNDVKLNDSLFDGGIIDSLGTLEVVQYLESEYDITITDDEMVADHFETIQSIASFVDSKMQPGSDAAEAS